MSESELVRANRQMMAERSRLLAELAQAKQAMAQRSTDIACQFVEGLEQLIAQAERGDAAAAAMLKLLNQRLQRAANVSGKLVVVGGN